MSYTCKFLIVTTTVHGFNYGWFTREWEILQQLSRQQLSQPLNCEFVVAFVVRLPMMSTLQRLHDLRTGDGINSGRWGERIVQYFVLGYIRWDIPSIFNLCSLSFIWLRYSRNGDFRLNNASETSDGRTVYSGPSGELTRECLPDVFDASRRHWAVAFSRFDRVTYVSVMMALQNSVAELYD